MRATHAFLGVVVGLAVVGCSGLAIVTTEETSGRTEPVASATTTLPPPSSAQLVDAFDYAAQVDGKTGYYFSTPSGRWQCAIVPRDKAGCESASDSASGLGITGEPDAVPDATGETTTPTAIVINREGDAQFVALDQPTFGLTPGPATVLPFDKILYVAGFRCNVQEESGVSCLSESTGNGFSFSADGYAMRYTEVP